MCDHIEMRPGDPRGIHMSFGCTLMYIFVSLMVMMFILDFFRNMEPSDRQRLQENYGDMKGLGSYPLVSLGRTP